MLCRDLNLGAGLRAPSKPQDLPSGVGAREHTQDLKLLVQAKPGPRVTPGLSDHKVNGKDAAGEASRQGEEQLSGFQKGNLGRKEQPIPEVKCPELSSAQEVAQGRQSCFCDLFLPERQPPL